MRFKPSTSPLVALALVQCAQGADSSHVAFLTAVVSDYSANKPEYIGYFATASSYPPEMTALALAAIKYTDNSYTTMLDNNEVGIASISSFATELPWFSRIESLLSSSALEDGSVAKLSLDSDGDKTKDKVKDKIKEKFKDDKKKKKNAATSLVVEVGVVLGAAMIGLAFL